MVCERVMDSEPGYNQLDFVVTVIVCVDVPLLRVAADEAVGIAGSLEAALIAESRLDRELVARLIFVLPLCTDLEDLTTELVSHYSGILGNVIGNALMRRTLKNRLVSRHTNAVGNDLSEYLIVTKLGELKLLEAYIVCAV